MHMFMHIFYPKEIPEETTKPCRGLIHVYTKSTMSTTAEQKSCSCTANRCNEQLGPTEHKVSQIAKPFPLQWADQISHKNTALLSVKRQDRLLSYVVCSSLGRAATAIPMAATGDIPLCATWQRVTSGSQAKGSTKNHGLKFHNDLINSLLPVLLLKRTSVDFSNIFYKKQHNS